MAGVMDGFGLSSSSGRASGMSLMSLLQFAAWNLSSANRAQHAQPAAVSPSAVSAPTREPRRRQRIGVEGSCGRPIGGRIWGDGILKSAAAVRVAESKLGQREHLR